MSIHDFFLQIGWDVTTLENSCVIILILMTFVQVTPIKLNPWSWIARKLGHALNGDVFAELQKTNESIEKIKKDNAERDRRQEQHDADATRNRILRFSDECRRGVEHSEEFFNQVIEDIDWYEQYCKEHEKYSNNKASDAIAQIREAYHECKRENKFI